MEKPPMPGVAIALNVLAVIFLLVGVLSAAGAIIGQELDPLPYGAAAIISGILFLGLGKIIDVLVSIESNTRPQG